MKFLIKLSLRHLTQYKRWAIPTFFAIVISVSLMIGAGTLAFSYLESSRQSLTNQEGPHHVVAFNVPKETSLKLFQSNSMASITKYPIESYAKITGINLEDNEKPYYRLVNINDHEESLPSQYQVIGELPKKSDEIVLGTSSTNYFKRSYKIGDVISLDLGKRLVNDEETLNREFSPTEEFVKTKGVSYKIVGFVNDEIDLKYNYLDSGFLAFVNQEPSYTPLNMTFIEFNKVDQLSFDALDNILSNSKVVYYTTYLSQTYFINLQNFVNSPIFRVLIITIVVAFLIGIASLLVLNNALQINYRSWIVQLSKLNELGMTSRQQKQLLLIQSLSLTLSGSIVGAIIGYGAMSILLKRFQLSISSLIFNGPVVVSLPSYIVHLYFLMVIIITIFLTYIPYIKVTNEISDATTKNVMKITDFVAKKLKNPISRLALKNFVRNRKQYMSLILSVSLTLVLIVVSLVFSNNLSLQLENSFVDLTYNYDPELLDKQAQNRVIDSLKNKVDLVGRYDEYILEMGLESEDINNQVKPVIYDNRVYGIVNVISDNLCENLFEDFDCSQEILVMDYYESSYLDENNNLINAKGSVLNTEATTFNFFGTSLDVKKEPFRYIVNDQIYQPNIYMSESVFNKVDTPLAYLIKSNLAQVYIHHQLFVNDSDPIQAETLFKSALIEEGIVDSNFLLNYQQQDIVSVQLLSFLSSISLLLTLLIIDILLGNILNTMHYTIRSRQKQIGILFSTGLSKREMIEMMIKELGIFGLLSFVVGGLLSLMSVTLVYNYFNVNPLSVKKWIIFWILSLILVTFSILFALFIIIMLIKRANFSELIKRSEI